MNCNRPQTESNTWTRKVVRSSLLGGACFAALMSIPAVAQDNGGSMETIVVTGIRGSLQRSLDIKRESTGLVDAVTSEDIGKFPDTNLAESIMRIPGITVTRGVSAGASTGATSTTGEATEITVRGFGPSFNQTLFDGRQVPSAVGNTQGNANVDRAFDFSSVNSDFVSQISVLKSPDASLSSGAIGATIDIKFPKPFDHPGLTLAGSFSGQVSPERGKLTPNGDVIVSDTFGPNDQFGVLVAASYTDLAVRQNHINIQAWNGGHISPCQMTAVCPRDVHGNITQPASSAPAFFIQDYGIYHELTNVERKQGRLVLQWRPTDAVEITLNDNFARDDNKQNQYGYSVWFNQGSLQQVALNSNGTTTNFLQAATPTDFQGQINGQVLQVNDFGGNVKWNVSENLVFTLDGDHSEAWLNPGGQLSEIDSDVGYGGPNAVDLSIVVPAGHGLPYPATYGPAGNKAMYINPAIMGSHVLPIGTNRNLDAINQFKVEGDWNEDSVDVKFGFQYVAEHKNEDAFDTFENNNWQAYSGYGPTSHNPGDPNPVTGVDLPDALFSHSFSTADFINGWSNSGNLPPNILAFNPIPVRAYLEGLGNPQTTVIPGANTHCCDVNIDPITHQPTNAEPGRPFNGIYTLAQNPSSHHVLAEQTYAGYLSATIKAQLAHMPLTIHAGARYEITNEEVAGTARFPVAPQGFTIQSGDPTAYDVHYSPFSTVTANHSYQYLLPNLDLTWSLSDTLDLRFNASRTLTRPPISQLNPAQSIGASRLNNVTATIGNPDLLPFLADNLDVGAQWYYQPNSYVSFDAFVKSVDNFIIQSSSQHIFAGAGPSGEDIPYTLSFPINGPAANVYGLEASLQHVFGETGFGFQLNGTIVGTDKPYNPGNLAVGGFAVTGLADSANFVGFYDKDGFQARIAINWQDSYLDHFGQLQNGSIFGTEPTFVNGSWNMDFTTSYDLTDQLTVYFEAHNLTDATYSTHGRYSEQLLDVVDYGRRFIGGVHFKL